MLDDLRISQVPDDVAGLVLMMHGGAEHSVRPVDHRSLALRRTSAMFDAISPTLVRSGIAVALLRFKVKGWNAGPGHLPSPVQDARAAISDLHEAFPDAPIVLLGHSMGARTAAWSADQPGVVGVVGLAPWFPADEPVTALTGKRIVAVHGSRDRITSPKASKIFIQRAGAVAEGARFESLEGRGHYMLAGLREWNRVAISESINLLDKVSESR